VLATAGGGQVGVWILAGGIRHGLTGAGSV